MPSLKDLRNRIDSVKSTKKITQAMKMVAASKLKKAQNLAENSRNYSAGIEEIVKKLVISGEYLEHPMMGGKKDNITISKNLKIGVRLAKKNAGVVIMEGMQNTNAEWSGILKGDRLMDLCIKIKSYRRKSFDGPSIRAI